MVEDCTNRRRRNEMEEGGWTGRGSLLCAKGVSVAEVREFK